MDYFSNVLKLPRWQVKKGCCILCQADSIGTNSWKNFSMTAPWISTSWSPATWHLFPGKSMCPLFTDIPGSSGLLCSLDFMHNKYLGADQYIFGSVMHLGKKWFFFGEALWVNTLRGNTLTGNTLRGNINQDHLGKIHLEVKTFNGHMNFKKENNFERNMRYLLVYTILQHGSPLQNLLYLETLVQEFYKQNPTECKFKHMSKLSMFVRKTGGPKLRGKAIEVRSFCNVLVHLWTKFHNPNLQIHRQVLVLLKLSGQVDAVLEEYKGEYALPAPAALKFKKLVFNMGHMVILLENHFKNEDNVPHLFTATSKLHGVAHAALWAEFVSPRLVWCFAGEDYMHHVQSLAQSCIAGTGPYLTVNKTVDKMRMALHIQFTKGEL